MQEKLRKLRETPKRDNPQASQLKCHYCSLRYYRYPSIVMGSRYCSAKCKQEDMKGSQIKQGNIKCKVCKRAFRVRPSHLSLRTTCSRECQGKYRTLKSLRSNHKPA